MKLKGILFDLFDTLVYLDLPNFKSRRSEIAEKIGVDVKNFNEVWKSRLKERTSGGIPNMVTMMETAISDLGLDSGDYDVKGLADMEVKAVAESTVTYPGVRDMLERLKRRGYSLCLVTNASESVEKALNGLEWMDLFDSWIFSYKVGVNKPEAGIYEAALEAMCLEGGECLFVGDGGSGELDGAKSVGFTTVKVSQPHQDRSFSRSEKADYLLSSITEVLALVRNIEKENAVPWSFEEAGKLWQELKEKDSFTAEHTRRVADIVKRFALGLGWKEEHVRIIEAAALLHDIGKLNMSDGLFEKIETGERLDKSELQQVKTHIEETGRFRKYRNVPKLILQALKFHHERYDGEGYPLGLKSKEIPMGVRMISIADFYDTVVVQREWKTPELQKPLSEKDALKLLVEESVNRFDPELVKMFFKTVFKKETAVT